MLSQAKQFPRHLLRGCWTSFLPEFRLLRSGSYVQQSFQMQLFWGRLSLLFFFLLFFLGGGDRSRKETAATVESDRHKTWVDLTYRKRLPRLFTHSTALCCLVLQQPDADPSLHWPDSRHSNAWPSWHVLPYLGLLSAYLHWSAGRSVSASFNSVLCAANAFPRINIVYSVTLNLWTTSDRGCVTS